MTFDPRGFRKALHTKDIKRLISCPNLLSFDMLSYISSSEKIFLVEKSTEGVVFFTLWDSIFSFSFFQMLR